MDKEFVGTEQLIATPGMADIPIANTAIKKRVMRRIYMYWIVRQALRPLALELFVMAGCFAILESSVSLMSIMHNMESSSLSFFWTVHYISDALYRTELSTKITAGVELLAGALVLSTVARAKWSSIAALPRLLIPKRLRIYSE